MKIDEHLFTLVQNYGIGVYFIIFLIIFLETGLVITPFLPGDSLLFAAGAIASNGSLNITFLFILLSLAAVFGDTLNYWIGNWAGPRVFRENSKFFKKEYLIRTQDFYEKHGGKTIILARFIPIIRTFAPFVAGIGKMDYFRFLSFNIVGGILWVSIFLFAGFYFGQIPIVKDNFEIVIIAIIIISVIPVIIEFIKTKCSKTCK